MDSSAALDPLDGQPIIELERDGVHYTLLDTAHVSRASIEAVIALIQQREFDAVAVELCEPRYQAMTAPESMAQLDVFQVIRQGKIGLVAANLALSAYQRRLAEQLGVEPGAEMRAAIEQAQGRELPVWRIDRDVGVTLRRTSASVGFWRRMTLMSGLAMSLIIKDDVDEAEIERLKQGDILESSFHEFASRDETLFKALIDERDRYMAARLRAESDARPGLRVLAVVGAGHLAGLARYLEEDDTAPEVETAALSVVPPPKPWGAWFGAALTIFLLGGFAWGFWQGADVGTEFVLRWVLFTGVGGLIGCLLAGGHPLSLATAFVVSPLTPFHPALSSGMASAWTEAWLRRPTVADFSRLRDDVGSLSGWWKNRVARVFVNFFLTNLGTVAGVYLAGWGMLKRLL
ncbi:MAG: TraB/GumN family protein [Gammaproteobacteria bacterium]|nr:TraB/GumN family protein [Gammaproteobacteria bacterium]